MSVEQQNAEAEHQHHTYSSSDIPWYVRVIWILFWVFVVYYSITYFMPAINEELLSPP